MAQLVVSVSPFRCRMWDMHDRLEHHINEETCRSEIDSFLRHGQIVPALGRKLTADSSFDVELIFGARRLFVARHLNVPLKVELRELSDQQALVAMDIENRQRTDISPYERGLSYARWLRDGYFKSQDDIARALKVSPSYISRMLKLTKLPAVVVEAFSSPQVICEAWGLDLLEALDDPNRRRATLDAARVIAALPTRPSAREVYQRLLTTSPQGRRVRAKSRDEVVRDAEGRPLFRIRPQAESVAVLLPLRQVTIDRLARIRRAIETILQDTSAQNLDATGTD